MKQFEKLISPFVESQFPSFYREEGGQFIAFVKAYYEWLESTNNPLWYARRLTDLRDIDTTLDEFIVYFKEKYLKNIQFDTATNKQLLIKNSLELYRSKGTERSIDLFFKLVYGTSAEVGYPGEKILRVSDGIWERPEYLEINYSKFNVDYVGKQIIGSLSGATAFVERYIRRRAGYGYVNLLYISGRQGNFQKGEVIGISVNGTPTYDSAKRASLIGSVDQVLIQDKGRNFKVGDIVSFSGSLRGTGGLARVTAVSEATGVVDFIFVDGGWGYTLSANAIVSEKVLNLSNVIPTSTSNLTFKLFETVVQPLVNANFISATSNVVAGDIVYSYHANNTVSSSGVVLSSNQVGASGDITIRPLLTGPFANSRTYYTTGNAVSISVQSVEDRTISSQAMGIPNTYTINITSQTGDIQVGDHVYQSNSLGIFARGQVSNVSPIATGNTIYVANAVGAFKKTTIKNEDSAVFNATITNVDTSLGVYNINKSIYRLKYNSATNANIAFTPYVYQYNDANKVTAKGLVLTSSYDAGTGNLSIIPMSGYFEDTQKIYTQSNNAQATLVTYSVETEGGDFVNSPQSLAFGIYSNTNANVVSVSLGSGAGFNVGTIGETEVIFIGTDLIAANNQSSLNYSRNVITVGSASGFAVGDYVYQEYNKIAFNPNTAINPTTGFITLPSDVSTRIIAGDIVKYQAASGNTVVNGLVNDDYYYVSFANSTGVILSYTWNKLTQINTTNSNFANNATVSEVGHYLYKVAYGTVYNISGTDISVKSVYNLFGTTAAGANVTTYGNSNLILYKTPSTNSAISAVGIAATITTANQTFYTLSPRAAAFGFPKNPQGDFKDTIYSCLSFGRFEIGTIGSLINVDPGADYNVDPYVLVYEKPIAGFGRHDYEMTVKDATSPFAVGEKVNQVQANLQFYDLKVDSGVYGNTYNEVTLGFNSKDEVEGTANAIYMPSNTVTFNISTDVDNDANTITIAGNPFAANDLVRYYTVDANTALGGLSNNTFYFVKNVTGNTITLSATAGGANVNLTSTNTANFHSNTNVSSTIDFISIASASTLFSNGDRVKYYTGTGNTALTGLTNNSIYYVVAANSTGLALSLTSGGANVDIVGLNPGGNGHYLKYYNDGYNGHVLRNYSNPYANDVQILYTTTTGNTAVTGLTNAAAYYVVGSNSVAIKLSSTLGGTALDLTAAATNEAGHYFATIAGFLPKDKVYQQITTTFNALSAVNSSANTITIADRPFANGDRVLYYTGAAGTVLTGLSNNSYYYVTGTSGNTLKLATTTGGTALDLTAGLSENHTLKSVANAFVNSVRTGTNKFVRVNGVENTLANGFNLQSYTNPYVNAVVSNVELVSIVSTAKGLVKPGSNTTTLFLERITFENTFQENIEITGDTSGAVANVVSVKQDYREYPIGLNADISANVITANGQIAGLSVVDSGVGYSNGEIVQVNSEDNLRSASIKVIIGGHGTGKGYYRSSKGFLSADMYIHDGDYYQEYSYEIFSKLSVDKYSDMFKKVMHTAGTKFFGSALVVEEDSAPVTISEIATGLEIEFDAADDVNSSTERIQVDIEKNYRNINPAQIDNSTDFITVFKNPFSNNDYIRYQVSAGNTAINGLTNGNYYYIVQANTLGVKLSSVANGSPLPIAPSVATEWGHKFTSYVNPIANGDQIIYRTQTAVTALTGLTNNQIYYAKNTNPISLQLATTSTGSPINITAKGSSEVGHYLIKIVEET